MILDGRTPCEIHGHPFDMNILGCLGPHAMRIIRGL